MKKRSTPGGWLLFFYSVPSKPVSNRMKVWRKLVKAGALQLKGSVYILPFDEEHREFLEWLVSEVKGMKGEGAFARVEKLDTMKDSEIIALFHQQRTNDYKAVDRTLDDLERRLASIQKGARPGTVRGISEQYAGLLRGFEEVKRIDFFSSKEGERLAAKIRRFGSDLKALSGSQPVREKPPALPPRKPDDYQGKTWVTRKRPFVDRMASAWLIRRFIDADASFAFVDEKEKARAGEHSVFFDMRDGEFTHTGDLCTFEVLMKTFGIRDRAVRKIAEIVHDLDVRDDKYRSAEARGLEDILLGIRKTAKSDSEALKAGMQVFEMFYMSRE